jgi:hypothetical protein
LTKIAGRHTFKFGGETRLADQFVGGGPGTLTFNNLFTSYYWDGAYARPVP